MCWLVFCVNLTQTLSYLGKEDLNWENDSIRLACRQACGVFSWLMIGVEALSSLLEVPILERWSHGEQARRQHFSKVSASVPANFPS